MLSVFVFVFTSTSLFRIISAVSQKPCQGNFGKFQRSFLKIPKWQHKLARYYKRGKFVSCFLNNVTKTCLYGLKISLNIEIRKSFSLEHFFISLTISTRVASSPLNHFSPALDFIQNQSFAQQIKRLFSI